MRSFNGLILIDKPIGWTSHDVVAKARSLLKIKKIGHAGTLDPLASGLLILLVGQATKLSDFILNGDKSYEVVAQLGVETDTLDLTGETLATHPVSVSPEQIQVVVEELTGELELPIPKYSAVKVNGRRLYKYAQQGIEIEELYRRSLFENVELRNIGQETVTVQLSCSKGGYIRSWAAELGRRLGCGAAVKELRRTASNPHKLCDALTLEELASALNEGVARELKGVIPLSQSLPDWRSVTVDGRDQQLLLNGQISEALNVKLFQSFKEEASSLPGIKVLSADEQKLLALLSVEGSHSYKIRRVFGSSLK